MTSAVFTAVPMAPADPILGITEAFNADPRPGKVNLGVGVYYDAQGRLPVLECVRRAETALATGNRPRGYLPIDGLKDYNTAVQHLLFGTDAEVIQTGRVMTAQSLGGTSALRNGADFLRAFLPRHTVLCSDPTWDNHRALFAQAGFEVRSYPYFDAATGGIAADAMFAALQGAEAGTTVVLHACCHNPTGADLTPAQWDRVIELCRERALVPFLDIAYQGFGEGLDADAVAVRKFAASGLDFLVASSFSKSFSLYGERVGALSVVTRSADEAKRVLSQVKRIIRVNYSNPATHGGAVVSTVLASAELRALWEQELGGMRARIRAMRTGLEQRLQAAVPGRDVSFITRQCGMFSYTGLKADQVARMRDEFAVHAVASGRICVAAINDGNLDRIATAMATVMK